MELNQIGQISITVHDVLRATSFYHDRLALKHLYSFPGLSFFDCGGIRLMLTRAETHEEHHASSILYFKVPDISEAYKVLGTRGVAFKSEPHVVARMETFDLWLSDFEDSEGNILCLMSEVPK